MKIRYLSLVMAFFMVGCSNSTTADEIVTKTAEVSSTSAVLETTTAVSTVALAEETVSTVSTEVPIEETTTVTSSETTATTTTAVTSFEKVEETTIPITKAETFVEVSNEVEVATVATSKSETVVTSVQKVTETSVSKSETKKEPEATTNKSSKKETRVVLPVENIQQLPELPAGCEVTATTIVMNYEGIKVDKMVLATYLPMMQYPDENGLWESPWNKFVGNPKLSYYGCYAPVIIETVESCLENNNIDSFEVVDISNSSMEELYAQIDDGHPVIVWATMFMKASYTGRSSWTLQDGTKFNWRSNEHCLVLIGYDTDKNTVILSDPYDSKGTVEYDADLFETRYTELYKQALIIRRKEK